MSLHQSPRVYHYWWRDIQKGPVHLPHLYMMLKRFEQIKRFIHISRPNGQQQAQPQDKRWWYKLEPLASSFEKAAQQYYQPGFNISIDDETEVRCFGRTKHTVKMPLAFLPPPPPRFPQIYYVQSSDLMCNHLLCNHLRMRFLRRRRFHYFFSFLMQQLLMLIAFKMSLSSSDRLRRRAKQSFATGYIKNSFNLQPNCHKHHESDLYQTSKLRSEFTGEVS